MPRSFGRTCARASTTKAQSLSALRWAAAASASRYRAWCASWRDRLPAWQPSLFTTAFTRWSKKSARLLGPVRWPAAQGEAKGPSALSTASWKWSFDIPVATVVKTAWRHCQARYDRMAAAGASSSPTTTAWTRASHGDLSSIVIGAQVCCWRRRPGRERAASTARRRAATSGPRSRQNGCPRRSLPLPIFVPAATLA